MEDLLSIASLSLTGSTSNCNTNFHGGLFCSNLKDAMAKKGDPTFRSGTEVAIKAMVYHVYVGDQAIGEKPFWFC